jgi:hypothetical protein
MWRSLVAHLVWDQGVAGSNPAIRTGRFGVKSNAAVMAEGRGQYPQPPNSERGKYGIYFS